SVKKSRNQNEFDIMRNMIDSLQRTQEIAGRAEEHVKNNKKEGTIMKFTHEVFGELRAKTVNGEILFVAKDVCDALGISNVTVAMSRLDTDEHTKFSLGRAGETNYVNESGLYTLIIRSRKPEAKKFRRWVTSEVLPSIRKKGHYSVKKSRNQNEFDIMRNMIDSLQRTQEIAGRAEEQSQINNERINALDNVNVNGTERQKLNGYVRKYSRI
ncbi:MAG: Bro-N domain-containing protein, partial [Candidatus Cloacimonadota bacterium]|nr:Bro-N domain-containing protein [Candidatus Cloacimonadota bacterium]